MAPNNQPDSTPQQPAPRRKKVQPIKQLDGIDPVSREKMARWFESLETGINQELQQLAFMQANGQEFPGLHQTATTKWAWVQCLKWLAWMARTARGGPLAGKPRKVQKCIDSAIDSKLPK